jgi:hypothetical protein
VLKKQQEEIEKVRKAAYDLATKAFEENRKR